MSNTNHFDDELYHIHNVMVKELAKETGIDAKVIEHIIRSQWDLLEDIISEGEFNSLRIKNLGIFGVKNARFKYSSHYEYHIPKKEIERGLDIEKVIKGNKLIKSEKEKERDRIKDKEI